MKKMLDNRSNIVYICSLYRTIIPPPRVPSPGLKLKEELVMVLPMLASRRHCGICCWETLIDRSSNAPDNRRSPGVITEQTQFAAGLLIYAYNYIKINNIHIILASGPPSCQDQNPPSEPNLTAGALLRSVNRLSNVLHMKLCFSIACPAFSSGGHNPDFATSVASPFVRPVYCARTHSTHCRICSCMVGRSA